jgi:hypothetical protein
VELVGGAAQPIGLGERARMVGFGRGVDCLVVRVGDHRGKVHVRPRRGCRRAGSWSIRCKNNARGVGLGRWRGVREAIHPRTPIWVLHMQRGWTGKFKDKVVQGVRPSRLLAVKTHDSRPGGVGQFARVGFREVGHRAQHGR